MPSDRMSGQENAPVRKITLKDILMNKDLGWLSIAKQINLGPGMVSNYEENSPDHIGPKSSSKELILEPDDEVQISEKTPGELTFQVDREGGITLFFHVPISQLKDINIQVNHR